MSRASRDALSCGVRDIQEPHMTVRHELCIHQARIYVREFVTHSDLGFVMFMMFSHVEGGVRDCIHQALAMFKRVVKRIICETVDDAL